MVQIEAVLKKYGYSLDTPWNEIEKKVQDYLIYGSGEEKFNYSYVNMYDEYREYFSPFEGVMPMLERRYKETNSEVMRESYEAYMSTTPCPKCKGARLKPEALAITIGDKNIQQVTDMTIAEANEFFSDIKFTQREEIIAKQIMKELHARLGFLLDVGLDYLTLSRSAGTLSGGEAQRIRLATQIGSGLVGVFIF